MAGRHCGVALAGGALQLACAACMLPAQASRQANRKEKRENVDFMRGPVLRYAKREGRVHAAYGGDMRDLRNKKGGRTRGTRDAHPPNWRPDGRGRYGRVPEPPSL
ncbi:MAG: hypothetical protein ACJ8J3_19335 [Burkholderia ambifaria]